MNQHYQKEIHFFSLFRNFWYLHKKESKWSSMILSVSLPIMFSTLSLLLYIGRISSEFFEGEKLIALVK